MGPIWQAQLGESLVMLNGPSWASKFIALYIGNQIWGPLGKDDVCPNFRQSPGLALNAHSGIELGKIPVLTGLGLAFRVHTITSLIDSAAPRSARARR